LLSLTFEQNGDQFGMIAQQPGERTGPQPVRIVLPEQERRAVIVNEDVGIDHSAAG
jgi:hypothetical protein